MVGFSDRTMGVNSQNEKKIAYKFLKKIVFK